MMNYWKHWFCIAWLCLIPLSGNAVTPMIAAGTWGSVFLNGDGSIWGTGPVPGYSGATSPVRVFPSTTAIAVATNGSNHYALHADGTLWGMGSNFHGELGDGTTESPSQPQRVPGLPNVRAFGVSNHALALMEDGTVWAWGANEVGQVGDGSRTNRYTPVQITGLNNIAKVYAGPTSSLALGSDGTVWVWGWTAGGAAGNGHEGGEETDPERYHLVPMQVPNLDQVIAISAGVNNHMALRADATVWTWGVGATGQNGDGTFNSNLVPTRVPGLDQVVAIQKTGVGTSLALKSDGTVWAWGNNNAGQLGVSGITSSTVPIKVPGVAEVVALAAGDAHVLAMRRDGTVLSWGLNSNGQLGDNSLQTRAQPLAVVGPGGTGQLNLLLPGPTRFNQLPWAQVELSASSGRAPLTVISSARNGTDSDGTITGYAWKSSDGQQASGSSATFVFAQAGTYNIDLLIEDNSGGRGSTRQQIVVAPASVSVSATPTVSLGNDGGFALANDGRILTWGLNGLLGYYDGQAQLYFPRANSLPIANGITGATALVSGRAHAHVLRADGTVSGWGINSFGEVGSGSLENRVEQPQQLPNLPPIQTLAAGTTHGLALARDGRVFAWGLNVDGQLGLGDNNNRLQPAEVAGLSGVQAIAAAGTFSVALKFDGTVWAWGDNHGQQLADGTQISRNRPSQLAGLTSIAKLFTTDFSIFAQKADGTVWVTGAPPTVIADDPGPRSAPRHLSDFDGAVSIAGTYRHIVVVRADGSVWTGGQQVALALGFPETSDVAGLKQIPGITDAVFAAAGNNNSVVLRRDGTLLAWGLNNFGQIGDGTFAQRMTPVVVTNETADGPLDLIPEVANDIPADKIPPFWVVTKGEITDKTATVSTQVKFKDSEAGKSGVVFVTARVPAGNADTTPRSSRVPGPSKHNTFADSVANSVLVQLTVAGWQPVTNGQLLPYASGVLGEQLAAQSILNNQDTTNIKGAEICVGYGSSAEVMIATGNVRAVASIPDPNPSGAAILSCVPDALGPSVPTAVTLQTTNGKIECLFNWAGNTYLEYLGPSPGKSMMLGAYYYRFYSTTNAYLAVSSDKFLYLGPRSGNTPIDLGTMSTWQATAGCG